MIDLSIIIVSYNVRHFLEQCLRSVYASKGSLKLEIFVVDNASSDDTLGFLREQFPKTEHPELHLVHNARNVGFGRANNQALSHATGRYVLFLNPDTVLAEDTLSQCVAFADSHADMGALGVMQLHSNGEFALESRHGIPTPWRAFCQMSGLSSLFPGTKTFDGYHMRFFNNEAAAPIEIASGAFMLIPLEALKETGGFDERFFMYCEDVDLCYRLLQSGRQNYYLPTPILHYKGASTRRGSFRYVHTFYSAMLIFFNKHYAKSSRLMSPVIRLGIYLRGLMSYAGKKLSALRHFLAPRLGTRAERQVFLGRHTAEVKAMAETLGFDLVCYDTDSQDFKTHAQAYDIPSDCVHVIFDLGCFSREEVLDWFRRSDHKHHIGMYCPESHTLIGGSFTCTLPDNFSPSAS